MDNCNNENNSTITQQQQQHPTLEQKKWCKITEAPVKQQHSITTTTANTD